MSLRVKNWAKFQHFKDRRPPWIKLYRDILDDPEWHELDAESSKYLVMLWLIASEELGSLPDTKKIAFRLRISTQKAKLLIEKLSHWLIQDDISTISERYQSDAPETETETETYKTETETDAGKPAVRVNGKNRKSQLPEGFGSQFSESMQAWLSKRGETQTKAHLMHFVGYVKANGKTYADWEQAFQNAIRDDWAGIRKVGL